MNILDTLKHGLTSEKDSSYVLQNFQSEVAAGEVTLAQVIGAVFGPDLLEDTPTPVASETYSAEAAPAPGVTAVNNFIETATPVNEQDAYLNAIAPTTGQVADVALSSEFDTSSYELAA